MFRVMLTGSNASVVLVENVSEGLALWNALNYMEAWQGKGQFAPLPVKTRNGSRYWPVLIGDGEGERLYLEPIDTPCQEWLDENGYPPLRVQVLGIPLIARPYLSKKEVNDEINEKTRTFMERVSRVIQQGARYSVLGPEVAAAVRRAGLERGPRSQGSTSGVAPQGQVIKRNFFRLFQRSRRGRWSLG